MSQDMEIRVIPPLRQWYERSAINPATFKAGETVVVLRSQRHEAKIAKVQRLLASSERRQAQWAPVVAIVASVAAIAGLVGTAVWVARSAL